MPAGLIGTIKITGFVPGNGPFPPITNCAAVGINPASGFQDTDGTNNSACVTVTKSSPSSRRRQAQQQPDVLVPGTLVPALPVQQPVRTSFDGFTIGVHGAAVFGNAHVPGPGRLNFAVGGPQTAYSDRFKPNGASGGIHIGYNLQSGQVVYGLAADIDFGAIKKSYFYVAEQTKMSNQIAGSLRGVIGYQFGNAMFYATAGLAVADVRLERIGQFFATPSYEKAASIRMGYVVGAGLAYAVSPNVLLSMEYRFADYGRWNGLTSAGPNAKTGLNTNAVRLGLTYRFGT